MNPSIVLSGVLWAVSAAMVVGYGAIGAALAFGVGALLVRRWKMAFVRLALGVSGFILGAVAIGVFAAAYAAAVADGRAPDLSRKARILAEVIATQMNCAAFGLVLGVLVGAALTWRSLRRARAGKTEVG